MVISGRRVLSPCPVRLSRTKTGKWKLTQCRIESRRQLKQTYSNGDRDAEQDLAEDGDDAAQVFRLGTAQIVALPIVAVDAVEEAEDEVQNDCL